MPVIPRDWTNLPDPAVIAGGLAAGVTITALRDNIIAMGQGAPGAQRIQGVALDNVLLGNIVVVGTTPIEFTDLDRARLLLLNSAIFELSAAPSFQVAFSNDNGVSYDSYETIFSTFGSTSNPLVNITIDLQTGALIARGVRRMSVEGDIQINVSTTLTVPSGVNAVRFRFSSGASNRGNAVVMIIRGRE